MIASIKPVIDNLRLHWWKWAQRELQARNPMHVDLPHIVRRINELERRA